MRMYSYRSLFIAVVIPFLSLTALAAPPLGTIKGNVAPVNNTNTAASAADIISTPGIFTPVSQLPGTIGTVKYSSDGSCTIIVLGGTSTPENVDSLLRGATSQNVRALGKDYFAILMCPIPSSGTSAGGTRVILSNEAGMKKVLAGRARVSAGSVFVFDWTRPNMLGSAVLANTHTAGGAKFLSEDYEIAFGTYPSGNPYFVILDKVGGKTIVYGEGGAYFAELAQTKNLYAHTVGAQLISAPRIIVAND